MLDQRDTAARLVVLRRLLSLVTDQAAAEAIRQNIAQLETAAPLPGPAPSPSASTAAST